MKNIRRANVTFLVTVVIAIIASFCFGFIPMIRQNPLLNILLSQAIYVIPVICYLMSGTEDVKELLRIKKVSIPNVFLLIVFAFFISPLLSFLNAVSLLFTTNKITDTVSGIVYTYPLFISLFVVAIIPAILEETVYRGVFFNEYRKVNARKGVILSGLLFGLMHMNFNQFIYAFIMGMIFALIVEVTDSIVSSMIIHFTINGSSVLITYLIPKLQKLLSQFVKEDIVMSEALDTTQLTSNALMPSIVFLGILAIFTTTVSFFILKGIAQIAKRPNALKCLFTEKVDYKMEKIDALPLIFGIMICLGIMIYQQCFIY